VSEWLLTGTTPDGVQIRVRGCDHWEFRNGKGLRKDSYWKIVEKPARDLGGNHVPPERRARRTLRRHRHPRRALRDGPAPSAARAGPERAGVRGRRRRRRHVVLEPLPWGAVRLRELDVRLFLLRRDPARVGVERALRGAAGNPPLLQLRGRQARPPP